MSDTPFDVAAAELERLSPLDSLAARGTLRIVLKGAGLDARTVRVLDLLIVIEKLLPGELASRGVDEPEEVCGVLRGALQRRAGELASATPASPSDVLRRIRGS